MKGKKLRLLFLGGIALFAIAVIAQSMGVFDTSFIDGIFNVAGSGSLAFAAGAATSVEGKPATTENASAASPDLNQNHISSIITRMRPSSNPLDTILRKVKKSKDAKSWKFEWYTSDIRGVKDTVKTAIASPQTGTETHDLIVNNIHIWSVHDTGRMEEISNESGKSIVFYVVTKDAANNKLVIIVVNGDGNDKRDLPAVPLDTNVTRLGVGKSELAAQHSPYNTYPSKDFNYSQRFMAQIEQSVFQELHKKEVQWGYNDYRLQALFDLRRSMELNTLFGEKAYLYNPVDEESVYLTGGITTYIDKVIEYTPDAIANEDFASWGKIIFQGNAGSDQRILFAGDELMVQLAKVGSIQKQLDAGQTKVVYGIRFNKIETSFGQFLIMNHELLRDAGWSAKGIVLDIPNVDRFVFKAMSTEPIDLKKSGQRNVKAEKIEETFGLGLRYKETHAIIQPADQA